jgi:hypothetical protein
MTDWEKISVISTSMALCVSAQVEVPPTTTENTNKHSLAILFYVYKLWRGMHSHVSVLEISLLNTGT